MATLSDRLKAMNTPVSAPVGPIQHNQTRAPGNSFLQDLFGGFTNPTGAPTPPRQPQQSVAGVPIVPQQNPNFQYTAPSAQYPAGAPIIPREPGQGPNYFDPQSGQQLTGPMGQEGTQVAPNQPNFSQVPGNQPQPTPYTISDYLTGQGPGGIFGPSSPLNQTNRPTNVTLNPAEMYSANNPSNFVNPAGQGGAAGGSNANGFQQVPVLDQRSIDALAQLQPQILQELLSNIQNSKFNREGYEREFQQNVLPNIAERLNVLSGGQQRGSGANSALAGAYADYQSQLKGLEQQYNLQRGNQLADLFRTSLTPTFESAYFPGSQQGQTFGQAIAPGASQAGTQLAITWLIQNWPWLSKLLIGAAV